VIAELEQLFSTKTRAEWMRELDGLDVCVGPVNTVAEAFDDPQIVHREMVFENDVPGVGPWTHVGNPLKMSGAPGRVDRRPPPLMGQHTAEVLADAGVGEAEIEGLRSRGVI
jgi:crotonobetainyl-CoA:carnitine CoA-transferase CaiB-like acyl-CoA transferase